MRAALGQGSGLAPLAFAFERQLEDGLESLVDDGSVTATQISHPFTRGYFPGASGRLLEIGAIEAFLV